MVTKKKEDPGLITTAQAAKLLMVSEAWIGKLHKMEYIPKAGRGRWNMVAVVQGYIRWLKDEERRSSKSASASRIQDLRADRLQMDMQRDQNELVSITDAKLVLDGAASAFQAKMLGVPARFTRDVAVRERLTGIIISAINSVAEELEDKSARLAQGQDIIEE